MLSEIKKKKFSQRGAILIEFAFAVPIMIMLLYYIHDLVMLRRYQRQMDFVGLQMASMVQSLASYRAGTDSPHITQDDLKNIMRAAYLTIYPGTTQYGIDTNKKTIFGHFPHIWMYYVYGTDDNKIQIKWSAAIYDSYSGNARTTFEVLDGAHESSTIKHISSGNASELHKDLKIKKGESKLVLECAIYCGHNYNSYCFADGTPVSSVPLNKIFKLYQAQPVANAKNKRNFFPSITIFSPRANAFTDNVPE